jgi:alkaline phosphatase D
MVEAQEYKLPANHPLRPLYLGQSPADSKPQPTVNLLTRHGVRACLEYQRTGDIAKSRAAGNPDLAPHLSFVDMGGHGYSIVRATSTAFETEFVCVPRPIKRAQTPDGGPLRYRARFQTPLWKPGETPKIATTILEGDAKFSTG